MEDVESRERTSRLGGWSRPLDGGREVLSRGVAGCGVAPAESIVPRPTNLVVLEEPAGEDLSLTHEGLHLSLLDRLIVLRQAMGLKTQSCMASDKHKQTALM